jgi:hypothetical protein
VTRAAAGETRFARGRAPRTRFRGETKRFAPSGTPTRSPRASAAGDDAESRNLRTGTIVPGIVPRDSRDSRDSPRRRNRDSPRRRSRASPDSRSSPGPAARWRRAATTTTRATAATTRSRPPVSGWGASLQSLLLFLFLFRFLHGGCLRVLRMGTRGFPSARSPRPHAPARICGTPP